MEELEKLMFQKLPLIAIKNKNVYRLQYFYLNGEILYGYRRYNKRLFEPTELNNAIESVADSIEYDEAKFSF